VQIIETKIIIIKGRKKGEKNLFPWIMISFRNDVSFLLDWLDPRVKFDILTICLRFFRSIFNFFKYLALTFFVIFTSFSTSLNCHSSISAIPTDPD
jgi:hypothetical protein